MVSTRWLFFVLLTRITYISVAFLHGAAYHSAGARPRTTRLTAIAKPLESLENLLFGSPEQEKKYDPVEELAHYSHLYSGNDTSLQQAHESLSRYLQMWASQLVHDKGLATPIMHTSFQQSTSNQSSMKLLFNPPRRALSFKEARNLEKGIMPDRKGAKQDSKSPGGVEVVVTSAVMGDDCMEMELAARRCGIDDDTIVKVTSERAIVRRLDEAIRIWKRVRSM